jgi:membrane protease YdiL (CAAX protease family)
MDKESQRREFIGFIGFFYALPIALLYFGLLPFTTYYWILMIMALILAAYAIQKGVTAKELGFRKDNLKRALIFNGIYSLIAVALLYVIFSLHVLPSAGREEQVAFYFFYVFLSAPIQEFIFRSLMFHELRLFFGNRKWMLIILSAVIFSVSHAFFHNWGVLLVTFVTGLFWGYLFEECPNYWAVVASHAFLGAVAVFLGIV